MPTAKTQRQADLAKIHIAKDELNLPDTHYRALVAGVMADRSIEGRPSSANLDAPGRRQLLKTLREMGWSPQTRPGEDDRWKGYLQVPGRPGKISQAQADYVAKMAFELGMLPDEEERLAGWIKRQTGEAIRLPLPKGDTDDAAPPARTANTGEDSSTTDDTIPFAALTRSKAHKTITGLQKLTGRREN